MRRLLLAGLSLVIALVLAELVVRAFVRVDDDGQRWLFDGRVLPHRLPLADIEKRLAVLDDPESLIRYDPDLGWSPRPGARSRDGLVSIDETGARRTGTKETAPDALRIVTVGDSFTFGDEVADSQAWPAQLEDLLVSRGLSVDVVNLGVNAYGIDQASLRFERDGAPLSPDVVILGLQPENLLRNVNVVRAVFFPETSVPLSKPRFVLGDDGPRVINRPAAPSDEVLVALGETASAPLLGHEAWLDERYESSWMRTSYLFSLIEGLVRGDSPALGHDLTPEMAQVGTHVIDRLAQAAEAVGARFVIVHLVRRVELKDFVAGRELWHERWLSEVGQRHELIRPERDLTDAGKERFQAGGHYSPHHNRHVAQVIAEQF